jgi:thymidylate kinase
VSIPVNAALCTIPASPDVMALKVIEAAVHDRVLIYGSLPPAGRDLDLLARPAERVAIRKALVGAGFLGGGELLVRFRPGDTEAVEVTAAESWGLSQGELESLFSDAQPFEGMQWIVRPSPYQALLITARRVAGKHSLPDKLRVRVDGALSEDPDAWKLAYERAPGWHAVQALRVLQAAYRGDGLIPAIARRDAGAEHRIRHGAYSLGAQIRILRSHLPRLHRTHVVALSGLDGAGKSSQASLIRDALEVAGSNVVVIWSWGGIGTEGAVDRVKRPIKQILHKLPPVGPWGEVVDRIKTESTTGRTPFADPGTAKRRGGFIVTLVKYAWAATVAGINVWTLYQAALRHFGRGRIIIFDRYTLDSTIKLKYRYGDNLATQVVAHLIHYSTPRPIKAYLLDVPPQVAYDRKPEWELRDLEARAALYRQEYAWLGVRRLDGIRPAPELSAEIAADIWRALTRQRDRAV